MPAPTSPRLSTRRRIPDVNTLETASRRFYGNAAQTTSLDATLEAMGAEVVRPLLGRRRDALRGFWVAERPTMLGSPLRESPEGLHPVTRAVIGAGARLSLGDALRGLYRTAALRRAADARIDGVAMLCVPSTPCFVTLADLAAEPVGSDLAAGDLRPPTRPAEGCSLTFAPGWRNVAPAAAPDAGGHPMPRPPLDDAALATLAAFAKLDLSPERRAVLAPALDGMMTAFDALDAVDLAETPPTNSFDARWRVAK